MDGSIWVQQIAGEKCSFFYFLSRPAWGASSNTFHLSGSLPLLKITPLFHDHDEQPTRWWSGTRTYPYVGSSSKVFAQYESTAVWSSSLVSNASTANATGLAAMMRSRKRMRGCLESNMIAWCLKISGCVFGLIYVESVPCCSGSEENCAENSLEGN